MDHTQTLHEVPTEARTQPAPEIERFPRGEAVPFRGPQVSWAAALVMAAAWILSIAIIEAVAPAADPDATLSGFEMLMSMAFTAALMVGAVGLALRQRLGVAASIAGGGLFVIGSISCWMGGHVGSWIAVQAVLGGAMMLLGAGVLRRS